MDGVVENKFNKIERGAEDYRLKANLSLEEITQIIIKCVLYYNNNHVLNHYESDGINIENGIPKFRVKYGNMELKLRKDCLENYQKK